jgi:hypothetical protein
VRRYFAGRETLDEKLIREEGELPTETWGLGRRNRILWRAPQAPAAARRFFAIILAGHAALHPDEND